MALNKVEICGVNTARLPILTNEEKDALFIQIRQGDAEAREQFIKGNLRLVLSVIRRFSSAGENVDDLFPDWLYRSDQGNRPFQYRTGSTVFNLCCSNDYWRDPAFSAGQQLHPGQPFAARYRL